MEDESSRRRLLPEIDDSSRRRHVPELDNSSRRHPNVQDTNLVAQSQAKTATSRRGPQQYRAILTVLLFLGNVISWYVTNGMNGIQMQHFAATVNKDASSAKATTMDMLFVSLTITSIQLLAGGLLGCVVVAAWTVIAAQQLPNKGHNPETASSPSKDGASATTSTSLWRRLMEQLRPQSFSKMQLAGLHAIGSAATNLGFLYGSASLVQIVKLLEPFETLLLSLLFLPATNCQGGIVASMMVTVGAAISLVKSRSKPAPWESVLFAILSGMTLSLRNVLQRRSLTTAASASPKTTATTTIATNATDQGVLDEGSPSKTTKPAGTMPSTSSPPALTASAKLAKSILSFTQLSTHAGVIMSIVALALAGFVSSESSHLLSWQHYASWGLICYHPLYNVFSMVTLGFCTALTHSLLNAGKRVYAIIIAIFWFREGFSFATVVGLVVVAIGGCWYTMESKNVAKVAAMTTTTTTTTAKYTSKWWSKPMLAFVILTSMYQLQQVSIDVDRGLIMSMFGTVQDSNPPPR